MISVLLFVFLLQLTIHLINTIGKQTINDLLWHLFTLLPTGPSREAQNLAILRRDVVRVQREMSSTSAQDEFAKWAKLRRQHDKLKEEYDTRARAHESLRANFNRAVSALRWLGTQGLQFLCNFWFSKDAMFWLPKGWLPWAGEWVVALPRAPMGSVSVNVWGVACATAIKLASAAIIGTWALTVGGKSSKIPEKAAAGGEKAQEKKEL